MRRIALGSIAKIDRTVASDEECERLPYVGLEDIEKGTGQFSEEHDTSPEELLATKFRFTCSHVLYGKLRPYLNKVALPTFDGVCSTEILPILPDSRYLDRTYLWAFLLSGEFVRWASNIVTGANLPRLSPSDLAQYEIPLPPLAEQRRIAAILRAADDERRRRRYTQTLSDGLLGEVFVRMFANESAKEWRHVRIKDLAKYMRTGPFGSQLLHSEFVEQGIAVLGIDNAVENRFAWDELRFITPKKYEELKRYTVHPGDVLITIMGTCGRCAIVPDDIPLAINTKHLCCITLDHSECLPSYLHGAFLYHPDALRQLGVSERGAVMPGLNMDIIGGVLIPLPPLELQREFAAIVTGYEQTRRQQQESARQSDHLFETLLHQAFAGEL